MSIPNLVIKFDSEPDSLTSLNKKLNFKLRQARARDLDTLSELWSYQRCYHEQWSDIYKTDVQGQQNWRMNIASCLKLQNHYVVLAEDNYGTIIGYIHGSICIWPYSPFNIYGSLNTLVIAPEFQGHGVGKKLVKKLLNWFQSNNVHHISVHLDHRNKIALHLYENLGFKQYQYRLMLNLAESI